jgi:hypothetical protein
MDFSPRRARQHEPPAPVGFGIPPQQQCAPPHKTRRLGGKLRLLLGHIWGRKKLLFIIASVFVAWLIIQQRGLPSKPSPSTVKSSAASASMADTVLEKGTPDFTTYLPGGKTIAMLGGWTRVSPRTTSPVYAYSDSIGAIAIIVSQQSLPDSFKGNAQDQLKELALNYGANEHLTIDGRTVYIGNSSKGPQSLLFYRDSTLILIKSSSKITNDQWVAYISSLK